MVIKKSTLKDIERKAEDLGCNFPSKIGILPPNFEDSDCLEDLYYGAEEVEAKKFLKTEGIDASFEPDGTLFRFRDVEFFSIDTFLITFVVPQISNLILNIISGYITYLLTKRNVNGNIKIITPTKSYEGPRRFKRTSRQFLGLV